LLRTLRKTISKYTINNNAMAPRRKFVFELSGISRCTQAASASKLDDEETGNSNKKENKSQTVTFHHRVFCRPLAW